MNHTVFRCFELISLKSPKNYFTVVDVSDTAFPKSPFLRAGISSPPTNHVTIGRASQCSHKPVPLARLVSSETVTWPKPVQPEAFLCIFQTGVRKQNEPHHFIGHCPQMLLVSLFSTLWGNPMCSESRWSWHAERSRPNCQEDFDGSGVPAVVSPHSTPAHLLGRYLTLPWNPETNIF